MRQLSDSVAAAGASLRVDLVGRTDPTGSDATNQSLAQLRVDAVARRLTALGVPAAMLHGRSVATSQPLRVQDTGEQARINRSVSFEVVVANRVARTQGAVMLQKKICMVGVFGTGKTCLVQRYVHSHFFREVPDDGRREDRSARSTGEGTAHDARAVGSRGARRDADINPSYLRGAHGMLYVVDGTRRETFDQLFEIQTVVVERARRACRASLRSTSRISPTSGSSSRADEKRLSSAGYFALQTSAKSGAGVEAAFQRLADATVTPSGAPR